MVSTAAGPPGTAITVSSASCEDPVDENAIIEASLYVGTAPDQQIAAYGSGYQGSVVLTVPDWVDPDQPAVIEASCYFFTEEGNDDFLEYDPVAFDIEPGIGAPVQVRTFSRTELLAGQGLIVNGSCGPDLANSFVTAAVFEGTDQTGKELTGIAGQGWAEADGDGAFELNLIVNDAFVGFGIEGEDEQVLDIVTEEVPMSIEPGDYTAFVYCSTNDEESLLFLEPQPLVITGTAPTGDIDLVNEADTRNVTLSGTCEAGEVTGGFESYSFAELRSGLVASGGDAVDPHNRFEAAVAAATPALPDGRPAHVVRAGDADRILSDQSFVDIAAAPDADGAWQVDEATDFDEGIVMATAFCGDPFADGFAYDPQGVSVQVPEPTTTVPTVPTTVPPAPPANAVQGTPDYAG